MGNAYNLIDKSKEKRSLNTAIQNVTITSLSYDGGVEESTAYIHNLAAPHSGEWTCVIGHLQPKSINVFVVTLNTKV